MNPGPFACEADVIPLHHVPLTQNLECQCYAVLKRAWMPRSSARPGPPAATSKNRQGSRRPGLSRRPARGRKRDRAATNVAKGHMGNERESRRATENVRTRERETENAPGQRDPWGSPGTRGRPQSNPRSPLPRRSRKREREREREPSVDHFLTASRPSITS